MARAIDVANFFIDVINGSEDDNVTNLKLQKLLYFSQGLFLRKTGKPLFPAQIKAWKHGPVVPEVYHTFKQYEGTPILTPSVAYSYESFTSDEKNILFDTLLIYGKYTGNALVNMTHAPNTPWSQVYQQNSSGKAIISNEIIKEYFDGQPQPLDFDAIIARIPIVDKLPKEDYDPEEDALWEE